MTKNIEKVKNGINNVTESMKLLSETIKKAKPSMYRIKDVDEFLDDINNINPSN